MEVIRDIIVLLFNNTMQLLNTEVPALGITFLQLFFGIFVTKFSLDLAGIIFGFGSSKEKGGNSKNVKVDDRRADDIQ